MACVLCILALLCFASCVAENTETEQEFKDLQIQPGSLSWLDKLRNVQQVKMSLLYLSLCSLFMFVVVPAPGSLPRLNVLPAAYQFIKFVAVCAQTFYWSWSVGSVILFSVSHSGRCQSYLPRYLSFDYPHSRSALKLQMRDWRGKNNFEFLFPASSYKCKSPDIPILMYIWWKWSFPWSACQIWLILQHLHNAIIFPP